VEGAYACRGEGTGSEAWLGYMKGESADVKAVVAVVRVHLNITVGVKEQVWR
jgi:hypothetical protein